jgi:ATP-binding cassette subfamily B protein
MATGIGALVLKDILGAIAPLFIRDAIDSLTRGFSLRTVLFYAVLLLGIAAVKCVFQFWMRVIMIGISRDIEYDLRNDLFRRLISLNSGFYARFRTGDVMARATNDLNAVRMMLGPGVMYWSETSLTFVLAVAVMISVDWPLTLVALIPAPLVSVLVIYFGRVIHDRFEVIQRMFSDISSRVQENLSAVRVVRAYVQEDAEMKLFEQLNRAYIAQNLKLVRASGLFLPSLQALIGLTFLIVLWVGGARLLEGRLTLGGFVMFNTYMGMLIWPMIAMGWVVNLMQRGTASLKRIREILEETPAIAAPASPLPLTRARGEIEFRGVQVRFENTAALDGVDMTIPAGSTVAVVGHTGSGKSTLVQLIPRMLDPTSGTVLYNGADVRRYDPADLRRHIGMIPQETFLFSATLRDNVAFGVESATEQQILEAVRLAGLEPDLASFPEGLDTMVGERGITLSGGQKQRTAIARAILRDPEVLILDDALSSVDTLTEERILRGLAGIMRRRTTILISHRVSTVRHADCIYVLEHGRIMEQGRHSELLELGGYYADLHQKQLLEEELEAI